MPSISFEMKHADGRTQSRHQLQTCRSEANSARGPNSYGFCPSYFTWRRGLSHIRECFNLWHMSTSRDKLWKSDPLPTPMPMSHHSGGNMESGGAKINNKKENQVTHLALICKYYLLCNTLVRSTTNLGSAMPCVFSSAVVILTRSHFSHHLIRKPARPTFQTQTFVNRQSCLCSNFNLLDWTVGIQLPTSAASILEHNLLMSVSVEMSEY
jgi:hypothetical protein